MGTHRLSRYAGPLQDAQFRNVPLTYTAQTDEHSMLPGDRVTKKAASPGKADAMTQNFWRKLRQGPWQGHPTSTAVTAGTRALETADSEGRTKLLVGRS